MANFEVFLWNFSSSTNPEIGRSANLTIGRPLVALKNSLSFIKLNFTHNASWSPGTKLITPRLSSFLILSHSKEEEVSVIIKKNWTWCASYRVWLKKYIGRSLLNFSERIIVSDQKNYTHVIRQHCASILQDIFLFSTAQCCKIEK